MTDVHGATPLPPAARVWYDPSQSMAAAQQPETTLIAKFESAPNDDCPNGALLDVNTNFVVYAVKNGLVRVLDRRSTLRTLLRGHESKVTDASFFQNGDILGTIGGNLIIWRIFTREAELTSEKVLEIPSDMPNMTRLMWHPFITNQFWIIHDTATDQRVATLVESTRIKTLPHAEESHPVCKLDGDDVLLDGALQLQTETTVGHDGINDLCWSGRDPRHVLTAHGDGSIRLWDVKQTGDFVDGNANPRLCLTTIVEEEEVTRCFFLPHDNVADGSKSSITMPFVTATRSNARITLWSPFEEGGGRPTKLSIFGMENPSPAGYNLSPCFGGAPLQSGPPASFLLLSDRSEGNLFAIALKSKWSSDAPKRAILLGLDYVVPFGVMHPIYSWSLLAAPAKNLDEDDEDATRTGPLMDMNLYSVQSRAVQILMLSHAMCVPPDVIWDETTPPNGVRVEPLDQAPMSTVDVTTSGQAFEEDYDLEDEQFEEYSDEDNQEVFDKVAKDVATPAAGVSDSGNPFANWLGAMVGKTSAPAPASQTSTPRGKMPPAPPPTPNLEAKTALPPDLPGAPPLPGSEPTDRKGSGFLSPIELLQTGSTTSDLESAANALPKIPEPNSSKGEKKKKAEQKKARSRSPKEAKSSRSNGGKKFVQPPMPLPSADGKIAILKRDDTASVPPVQVSPSNSGPSDVEEVLKRVLASHFKKQESLVANEIQRTVRAEIQSTVLPALSKTLTQTMEQAVVKPLQVAIAKGSKESTKVRTDEVITAISGGIEAPLKESFQESMKTALIPAYEAATREMFSQISSSLHQGLSNDGSSETLTELSTKLDSMAAAVQALSTEVSQLRASGTASGCGPVAAADLAPPVDSMQAAKSEIVSLLGQKAYEAAFTKALSTTTTAELAVFCCKKALLSDVLGGATPALSQPILLCLMQQLGASLLSSQSDDLRIELEWLQEIALVLDPKCESIQRHVGGVLQQLVASINAKMAQGDPTLRRPLQMLLQVIRGMQ